MVNVSRCIGCGNCVTICPPNWIKDPSSGYGKGSNAMDMVLKVVRGQVEMLNFRLCDACRKCIPACPTGYIQEILRERDRRYAAMMRARRR